MTQTMTVSGGGQSQQEQSASTTVAMDYHIGPDHVDLRMSPEGTTLPGTIRLSKNLEFETIVPDNPGSISEKEHAAIKSVYGPLFKQASAFCGQRWTPGQSRRIDLPFPTPPDMKFDVSVSARLLGVGRLYGRRTAEFEVTMTGHMAFPRGQTEIVGSGTTWADVETGVTLDSIFVSVSVMSGLDLAPAARFELKEERRLDSQMSRF